MDQLVLQLSKNSKLLLSKKYMTTTIEKPLAQVIDFKLEKSKRDLKKYISSMVDDLRQAVKYARSGDIEKLKIYYGAYGEKVKTIGDITIKLTDHLDEESKTAVALYIKDDIVALAQATQAIDNFLQKT